MKIYHLDGRPLLEVPGNTLAGADLHYADLRSADLQGVDLQGVDLQYANLRFANLQGANLRFANLRNADLRSVDLRGADLRNADLRYAILRNADLRCADLPTFQIVPEKGSFVGFKKTEGAILELELSGQRTSSLVGRKCRASHARVLAYRMLDTKAWKTDPAVFKSKHDPTFFYRVGQAVSVSDFDADIRVACAAGIHFFITEKEAVDY